MDSRDYMNDDGWPEIAPRDKLPIVSLIQGAAVSAKFEARLAQAGTYSSTKKLRHEIGLEREAIALALSLPSWWHCCPVRAFKTSDKPRPPPKPTKPLYIWLKRKGPS